LRLNDFLPGQQLAKPVERKDRDRNPLAFYARATCRMLLLYRTQAQEATRLQMKMFLTVWAKGRVVITGDRTQSDLPRGVPSGLQARNGC